MRLRVPMALAALLVTGAPATSTGQSQPSLAEKARSVLRTHCYECHGKDDVAKGKFGYVLDPDRLIARGKVVPGDAAGSELYQRLHAGEMPPAGKRPRPSAGEIATIKEWIEAGVPGASAAQPRQFVGDAALRRIILTDLRTVAPRQQRFVRYLTFTHLSNAGASDGELQTSRHALSKLVNSLSWHPRIARPTPVDAAQTVYRLDLRHYRWTAEMWERLVTAYPYRPEFAGADGKALAALTRSELPYLRADWFIATASRPPHYHDLLQLPTTDRGLERLLQVDVAENLKQDLVARAGFNDSGVSKNNRLIERHDALFGAYWRSYDFGSNTERQNLFEHPLGPNTGATSFAHDGGEIIFNLPNGLQAYMLVDRNGRRIDKGPVEIVSDPKRPDRLVENGLSCMTCHARGLIPKADQIRGHVAKNATAFVKAEREAVEAIYPPKARMQALMGEDIDRFVKALARAGVPAADTEPVSAVTLRYEATLDLRAVAAEFGMPPAEFQRRLAAAPAVQKLIGAPLHKGGTVQRQVFEQSFAEVARTLGAEVVTAVVKQPPAAEPFAGHTGSILCVAFSPDGSQAASGGDDRTIRLWDVATGRELHCLKGHTAEVTAVAFTPDGKRLLSGGRDRLLRLWDLKTGEQVQQLAGHTDAVRCVAVSPNGKHAISGGDDGSVRFWLLIKAGKMRLLGNHVRPVTSVAFSGDGRHAASAGLDGAAVLWDVKRGKQLQRLDGHAGEVHAVALSKDGRRIASGGNDRTVRLWDAGSGKLLHVLEGHANAVVAIAFAADGREVLSGSSQYRRPDQFLRRWDAATGRLVHALGREGVSVAAVAFAPDGRSALTGGSDRVLRLWQVRQSD